MSARGNTAAAAAHKQDTFFLKEIQNEHISSRITKLRTSLKCLRSSLRRSLRFKAVGAEMGERRDNARAPEKLIQMSKKFNISLDALVVGSSNRTSEGSSIKSIEPPLENPYSYEVMLELHHDQYMQSYEEGKDIEPFKDVFQSISEPAARQDEGKALRRSLHHSNELPAAQHYKSSAIRPKK